MYVRLVIGVNMIDCDLNFEGLVRIEHKWPEANDFAMRISKRWDVRHVATTALKRKSLDSSMKTRTMSLLPALTLLLPH